MSKQRKNFKMGCHSEAEKIILITEKNLPVDERICTVLKKIKSSKKN